MDPGDSDPAHILVRGVNWLGDAVMTTPALIRLRERFPDARINLLCHEKLAALWENHTAINEVVTFSSNQGIWSVAAHLRRGNYDTALVLPNSPRAALEPWLARIPKRFGYARPLRTLFLTRALPPRLEFVPMVKKSRRAIRHSLNSQADRPAFSGLGHQVHEYLHLVGALGARTEPLEPRLHVTAGEILEANALLRCNFAEAGVVTSNPLLIGINPGAEYGPAKRWPLENFAAVMREISRRLPEAVYLLFGGPQDVAICTRLAKTCSATVINFAGKTSLRQLMALLKECRVLLTNDTGPMHVAAALGTRVVVPFGSTSPELTGPGLPGGPEHALVRSDAACAPCFRRECPIDFRCMTRITPKEVVEAVCKSVNHPH
jgi:heptosyltransferase-2